MYIILNENLKYSQHLFLYPNKNKQPHTSALVSKAHELLMMSETLKVGETHGVLFVVICH